MIDLETKRAQNAERQKRYRMRQKMRNAEEYRAQNAQRQRQYRKRQADAAQAAPMFTPELRMLAHLAAHPGASAPELFQRFGLSRDAFMDLVLSLVKSGRIIYTANDQLFLSRNA